MGANDSHFLTGLFLGVNLLGILWAASYIYPALVH
jgi:hypothetical protein